MRSSLCFHGARARVRDVGGLKQSTFCMARRKTVITMGSPDFVWINTNEIISSWYLLGAACVAPSSRAALRGPRLGLLLTTPVVPGAPGSTAGLDEGFLSLCLDIHGYMGNHYRELESQ